MKKVFASIFWLLSLLLLGCQLTQKADVPLLPDIGVTSDDLNKDLDLFLRPSWNSFKIGDDIVVDLHLKSDIQVKSDARFNARIYLLDKPSQNWIEVPDFITNDSDELTFGTNEILLNANIPNGSITVRPIIKKQDEEATLLIMIKGVVIENNQEVGLAGSYIILTLTP